MSSIAPSATLTNSNDNGNANSVAAPTTKRRVAYRFNLTFPEVFTLRDLRNQKQRKVQYITIYKRIEAGLKKGEIVEVAKYKPAAARSNRGRPQAVYARTDVKNVVLAIEKAAFKGSVVLV